MKKLSILAMLPFLLSACSRNENPEAILKSPNGDYTIELYGTDLGACCTSRMYANIISKDGAFAGLDEKLFEIEGGEVRVDWAEPYHVHVRVCNAKSITYKSDFSNYDFSQYIHVSVENILPQRADGEVICPEKISDIEPS